MQIIEIPTSNSNVGVYKISSNEFNITPHVVMQNMVVSPNRRVQSKENTFRRQTNSSKNHYTSPDSRKANQQRCMSESLLDPNLMNSKKSVASKDLIEEGVIQPRALNVSYQKEIQLNQNGSSDIYLIKNESGMVVSGKSPLTSSQNYAVPVHIMVEDTEDQLNSQMNSYYQKRKKGKQNRKNRNLKQIQSMDFTSNPHEDPTTP